MYLCVIIWQNSLATLIHFNYNAQMYGTFVDLILGTFNHIELALTRQLNYTRIFLWKCVLFLIHLLQMFRFRMRNRRGCGYGQRASKSCVLQWREDGTLSFSIEIVKVFIDKCKSRKGRRRIELDCLIMVINERENALCFYLSFCYFWNEYKSVE